MTDASPLNLPNTSGVPSDCLYNLKPSSVRARSYRGSLPTTNKSTFNPSDTAVIYVPGGRRNCYADCNQSYLRFTVQNNDTVAGNYFFFDNLASSIINRLDVYHASNMLETIQQYNVLMSYIVDAQLNQSEKYGLSNIYGTSNSAALINARQGLPVYPGQRVTIVDDDQRSVKFSSYILSKFISN